MLYLIVFGSSVIISTSVIGSHYLWPSPKYVCTEQLYARLQVIGICTPPYSNLIMCAFKDYIKDVLVWLHSIVWHSLIVKWHHKFTIFYYYNSW